MSLTIFNEATTAQELVDLKSCKIESDLQWGRIIHAHVVEAKHYPNLHFSNTLVSMYGKCGCMAQSRIVFDNMKKQSLVSWNALLLGYAENGQAHVTWDLFSAMKSAGYAPSAVTYLAVLKACMLLGIQESCLEKGREVHLEIGYTSDQYLQNTLIDMYAKCSSMYEARDVFDRMQNPSVVSWNALLLGYAENGEGRLVLDLFSKMKKSRCAPDSVTYVAVLKACTSLAAKDVILRKECLQSGREIHLEIGGKMDRYIQGTLIEMYAKCGSMVDAQYVFEKMRKPDLVSWNTLLLGYADNGEGYATLNLFSKMKRGGFVPDCVTYLAILKACSLLGALALGRGFTSEILEFTPKLVTCLVDFYAKCGSMDEAQEKFQLHSGARDVTTWTALLGGYSRFGDADFVLNVFKAMQDQGVRPNALTFSCLLLCCSHGGLVEKAGEFFEAMPVQYGVNPDVVHYNCMVDVLGRANQLKKAAEMIRKMPCNPDHITWMTLLAACCKWKNVEFGEMAFDALAHMGQRKASAYLLMANIYGSNGMWDNQKLVLALSRTATGLRTLNKLQIA